MESKERKIKQITMRESILTRAMWGGRKKALDVKLFCINEEEKFTLQDIKIIPVLYKCFDEIAVNAIDHYTKTRKVKNIHIDLSNDGRISVRNDGPGIPVEKIKTTDERSVYTPQMAFTEYLSGDNLDDKDDQNRIVGGSHGLGAKITCVYSDEMIVETVDTNRGLFYRQTFRDTLLKIENPYIYDYKNKKIISDEDHIKLNTKTLDLEPHTKIEFMPKYELFNIELKEHLVDLKKLIHTRAYQMAAFVPVNVYFNGKLLDTSFKDFCSRFIIDEQPIELLSTKMTFGGDSPIYKDYTWDIYLGISDGKERSVSLINGVFVSEGGQHINHIQNSIINGLRDKIEKIAKENKTKFNKNIIINNLFIFIKGFVPNADFKGQTKEILDGSHVDTKAYNFQYYEFSKIDLDKIWAFIREMVEESFMNKILGASKKRTTRQKLDLDKYIEADNCSDPNKCHQCGLILTEGDSASGTAKTGLSSKEVDSKFNYKWFGLFSLGGVIVNGLKESVVKREDKDKLIKIKTETGAVQLEKRTPNGKIFDNNRIKDLRAALGLDHHKTYETDEEFKTLRYGYILGLTDQDLDGFNIFGLVCTYFLTYFPYLVKRGFVRRINTPVIRAYPKASKKLPVEEFYSERQYKNWAGEQEEKNGPGFVNSKYKIKYYKGLATHVKAYGEVNQMFKNIDNKICQFILDENAIKEMFIHYGKPTDSRKESLRVPVREELEIKTKYPISVQFNHFAKKFQQDNIFRKLLDAVDGFVASRRKVFYVASRLGNDELKVANLANKVSLEADYHHGEGSLEQTITKMAQAYPKARNLPLLIPLGEFGTLDEGYKNAGAPRYIYTRLNKQLALSLFRKEDEFILEYEVEDGTRLEPKRYAPIIPYSICENNDLPGTGWRITIVARNIMQVIQVVRDFINDKIKKCPTLKPEIYGFKGEIVNIGKGATKKEYYLGAYDWDEKKNKLTIKELPPSYYSMMYLKGTEKQNKDRRKGKDEGKKGKPKPKAKVSKKKAGAKDGNNADNADNNTDNADTKDIKDDAASVQTDNTDNTDNTEDTEDKEKKKISKVKIDPDDNKNNGFAYSKYVKSYSDYTSIDNGVLIELTLHKGAYEEINKKFATEHFNGIIEYFELKERIYHRINMIGINGEVIEYKKYEDVFKDWFAYRKVLYGVRVEREILLLDLMIEMLKSMQRYSKEHDKYHINNKTTEEQAISIFRENKYKVYNQPLLENPKFTSINELHKLITNEAFGASYDYLLNMRDRDKTEEAYKKRADRIKELEDRLNKINVSGESFKGANIWLEELNELENAIKDGRASDWFYGQNNFKYKE